MFEKNAQKSLLSGIVSSAAGLVLAGGMLLVGSNADAALRPGMSQGTTSPWQLHVTPKYGIKPHPVHPVVKYGISPQPIHPVVKYGIWPLH